MDHSTPPTVRLFSLPLARTFLLFSALVYERSDVLVTDAVNAAASGDMNKAEHLLKKVR